MSLDTSQASRPLVVGEVLQQPAGGTPALHAFLEQAGALQRERPEVAAALLERALRRRDPLLAAYQGLTGVQKTWLLADVLEKLAEGGNQSGKTWTACIDYLMDALGMHPIYRWKPEFAGATWRGWWCAVSYDLFGQQGWEHFKRLLLFPGESVHHLPTRRILEIGWEQKSPERPMYVKLRRVEGVIWAGTEWERTEAGGVAETGIRSYEQGAGKFQSAGLQRIHMDEEDKAGAIYQEVTMRGVAKAGARITHSCTPVIGVEYIVNLRDDAESKKRNVCHARFDTRDNPVADPVYIADVITKLRHRPELIDLRLGGYPVAMEGVVYNDLIFDRAKHVCAPFRIPTHWTRFRVIDPSWRNSACAWFAVSPSNDYFLYRDYIGQEKTLGENCKAIVALTGAELIARTWIDRHYCEKHEESGGEKIIALYAKCGVRCEPSFDIGITPGIFQTWELLNERTGPRMDRARFQVFSTCVNFLDERKKYRWPEARSKGNEGVENPVDRDNHILKCFVYFCAAKPRWVRPTAAAAPVGSMRAMLEEDRRGMGKGRGKL